MIELYSFGFLIFVIIGVICSEIAGKYNWKYQWLIRFLASAAFYVAIVGYCAAFLCLSALCVWAAAIWLNRLDEQSKKAVKREGITKDEKKSVKKSFLIKKRIVLVASLVFVIGLLVGVKYLFPIVTGGLLATLGMSFYTMMAVSYVVDVYGGKYDAQHNPAKVVMFLMWFPQMIQGPINRYDEIEKTLFGVNRTSWDNIKKSMLLFLFGAMKKYAIANVLANPVGEILSGNLADKPGAYLLGGAFLFAIQQYADFSGGIDMVLAVSNVFGVEMQQNFRQPYFSKSIAEFWRRWHISLGKFMRDYVFYPFAMLKGMRKLQDSVSQKWGKHLGRALVGGISNIIVFLLVGIWHGCSLHYVLWGLYNGVIIALSDLAKPLFDKTKAVMRISNDNRIFQGMQMLRTFILIVLAGYFDRVEDARQGLICFKNTFMHFNASQAKLWFVTLMDNQVISLLSMSIVLAASVIVLISSIMKECGANPREWVLSRVLPIRWIMIYAMIIILLLSFTVVGENIGFMYGAF